MFKFTFSIDKFGSGRILNFIELKLLIFKSYLFIKYSLIISCFFS